jgi:hypothetical protein
MPTLYITEYGNVAFMPNSAGQVPEEPPIAEQTVAITGGSSLSAVFQPKTRLVRIQPDAICSILFGFAINAPAATIGSARLIAGQTEYRGVPENNGVTERQMQVAVIANV